MTDPKTRPQRIATRDGDAQVIVYDFHVDIEVKAASLDEKRLQQLIDERLQQLASSLANRTP